MREKETMQQRRNRRPLIAAATALGIGMGGFVDGIVFHQLLQAHNMLSARFPTQRGDPQQRIVNLEINMFWDGLFHVFTWLTTAAGIALLWHAVRRSDAVLSTRTLLGGMALGWGLFNLVEGILNHHVLHLHHVTETEGHFIWDAAFLFSGAALVLLGWTLLGTAPHEGHNSH